ncbi:MAG: carbohydrate-binding domain-containing protein [Clostridia bacterium]|nr:carbohydrate-binding domain-containing protein [Clostridia bacterium]
MNKKIIAVLLVSLFAAALLPACSDVDTQTSETELSGTVVSEVGTISDSFGDDDYFSYDESSESEEASGEADDSSDEEISEDPGESAVTSQEEAEPSAAASETSGFADGDNKTKTDIDYNATITLDGSEGILSDSTRGSSGSTVTITSKGTYLVTGTSDGVSIVIDDEKKSGNVYLVLKDVTMSNSAAACICAAACDKLVVQCIGSNSLTFTGKSSSTSIDGAIYSKDNLTVNGSGSLTVVSTLHGIVCNDDLKITGGKITVTAGLVGLKANDSLRIGGGTVDITSVHDGIQIENDAGTSFFYIEKGNVTVNAAYDGVQVSSSDKLFTGNITLAGGTLDITAGGGSGQSKGKKSRKGLKCEGDIYIGSVDLKISSADDAIHCSTSVSITDGKVELSSSDDAIHAGSVISISGGELDVTKCYEGLEAYSIEVKGGKTRVIASDDGVNAAGSSGTVDDEDEEDSSGTGAITVSGGYLYVNSGGDGLDSNGSIFISGGTVIVEGPSGSGNGALDIGEGGNCVASITGGTLLAIGSTDMAKNFNAGTQCSALVGLSGGEGTVIAVDDGSGFSFTASKVFGCIVYSSPNMAQGNSYVIRSGDSSATADFSSGLYYSDVQ